MKKLVFTLALFCLVSCIDKNDATQNQTILAELKLYQDFENSEELARQLMKDYIRDVNSSDWKSKIPNYFKPTPALDAFLEEHSAFRASFPNYKSTIKHMAMDGNKGIVWMNITANYVETYTYDNSVEVVKDIEAKNQALSWDEAWAFGVNADGNFNDEWYYLKDNYKILEDLKE